MSSRKSKRDKRKEKQKKRARQSGAPTDFPVLSKMGPVTLVPGESMGREKMSDVLMEFVEPYSEFWESEEQLRKLLTVALVAWNAAVVGSEEGEKLIAGMAQTLPPEARGDFLEIVIEMVERKLLYFADNRRMILDYQLTMEPTGPYLQVASTLDSK